MISINALSVLLLVAGVNARTLSYDVQTGDFSEYAGLYQSVLDEKTGKLIVTNSVGRPPVNRSDLLEVDAATLKVTKDVSPAKGTYKNITQPYAVYGVDIDQKKNLIWVTNTRQDTVAYYNGDDLSLGAQYPTGLQNHPRDVYVDANTNLAWVSASTSDVLDAFSPDKKDGIFKRVNLTEATGKQFSGVMSLVADEEARVLYTVSLSNSTAAAINLDTYDVKSFDLGDNAKSSSGVAWDSKRKHLFIANQRSNNTLVLDPASGKILKDISLPGGPLNARYDSKYDVVYVANRLGHSVSVIDPENYEIITELKVETPNHIAVGPKGEVYVTDKSKKSLLYKFTPKGNGASNSTTSGTPSGGAGAGGRPSGSGGAGAGKGPSSSGAGGRASGSGAGGAGGAGASGRASSTGAGRGSGGASTSTVRVSNGAANLAVPVSIGALAAISLLI